MKVAVKLAVVLACCGAFLVAAAPESPSFHSELREDDPWDQTIASYWEKVESGEATPVEMVDLGTMLFFRGLGGEAVEMYELALDQDPELYEGWFRLGFVKHRQGDLKAAKRAYKKCLKLLTGHGPCNFYMGLLEEQRGNPEEAMDFYRRAFKFAPSLADPAQNPDLMYSDLRDAALVSFMQRQRFNGAQPMAPLEPEKVAKVRSQFEPEPTPVPERVETPVSPQRAWVAPASSGSAATGPADVGAAPPRGSGGRSQPSDEPDRGRSDGDGDGSRLGGALGGVGSSFAPQIGATSGEGSIP